MTCGWCELGDELARCERCRLEQELIAARRAALRITQIERRLVEIYTDKIVSVVSEDYRPVQTQSIVASAAPSVDHRPTAERRPPRIFWVVNVYGRLTELRIQTRLIRRYFGDRVKIMVFTTAEQNPGSFKTAETDIFVAAPNSGHHNGVRDSYNASVAHVTDDIDIVVTTHADCLFNDYSAVDAIIDKMLSTKKVAAATTGNKPVDGSMENAKYFGYYVDFFATTRDTWRRIWPSSVKCDGGTWIEVLVAQRLHVEVGRDAVLEFAAENIGASAVHDWCNVLENSSWWFSGAHDLTAKLAKLAGTNPQHRDAVRDIVR